MGGPGFKFPSVRVTRALPAAARRSDHTYANVKALCGSKKGGPKLPRRKVTADDLALAAAGIPTDFDPRTKWTNCPSLNEIRDQAACGSCWAFGAVEAMTDRCAPACSLRFGVLHRPSVVASPPPLPCTLVCSICIASNGANQAHLSAQDMNSCCDSCGDGCNGGTSLLCRCLCVRVPVTDVHVLPLPLPLRACRLP